MGTIRSLRAPGAGAHGFTRSAFGRCLVLLGLTAALAGQAEAQTSPSTTDGGSMAKPGGAGAAAAVGAPVDGKSADRSAEKPVADNDSVPLELRDPAAGKSNLWYFQTSLYTRHFHPDERHDNHQKLLNLEYWRDDGYLAGLALFHNSFGQPSQYVYIGKRWRPFDSAPAAYVKLTGGLLHGYKGEYKDKIPFNSSGVAPAIIPAIGYSGKRFSTELTLFGFNGAMWSVGVFFY